MSNVILVLLLLVSVLANGVMGWMLYKVVAKMLVTAENFDQLTTSIESYRSHLKSVYELEMFYGEPTLEKLIAHTRELSMDLEQYEDVASYTQFPVFEDEDEDDDATEHAA